MNTESLKKGDQKSEGPVGPIKLDGLTKSSFLTFVDVDIHTALLDLARNATILTAIAKHSIKIVLPPKVTPNDINLTLLSLLRYGNKLMDSIYFLATRGIDGKKEAFEVTSASGSSEEITGFDITKPSIMVVAVIALFHSRGSLPDKKSTIPLPRLFKRLIAEDMDKDYSEGSFVESIASFDLGHINLSSIYTKRISDWGLNEEFRNRMILSMAGHKPYNLCQTLLAQYGDFIVEPSEILSNADACSKLVSILGNPDYANCRFSEFHPSSDFIGSHYGKFYRNCLWAIYFVLINSANLSPDAALHWLQSSPSLRNEQFIRDKLPTDSKAGVEAEIKSWVSTIRTWDFSPLQTTMKNPWYKL